MNFCLIHVNIGYHNLFSILYTIISVFSHLCMQFHYTSDPAKAVLTGQPSTAICNNCGSRQQLRRITNTVKHSVGDILTGTKPLDRYVLYILVFKSSPPWNTVKSGIIFYNSACFFTYFCTNLPPCKLEHVLYNMVNVSHLNESLSIYWCKLLSRHYTLVIGTEQCIMRIPRAVTEKSLKMTRIKTLHITLKKWKNTLALFQ